MVLDTKRRTLVVGDIHGCREELELLLKKADFRVGRDRLVLCGDLVDRGPDSAGVVRLARELKAISVLGNHEEKHLRYRKHEARVQAEPGYKNPMYLSHPEAYHGLSESDWAYLKAMPLVVDIGDKVTVVHGGFSKDSPRWRPLLKSCRVRYVDPVTRRFSPSKDGISHTEGTVFWSKVYRGTKNVIYGHHVVSEARKEYRADGIWTLGLDTGCCFGRELTGYWIGTGELVSVKSLRPPQPKAPEVAHTNRDSRWLRLWDDFREAPNGRVHNARLGAKGYRY